MKKEFSKKVGSNIKRLREGKKISQTELADKVGRPFQQISKYERGVSEPRGEMLTKLAEALEVSPREILEGCVAEGTLEYTGKSDRALEVEQQPRELQRLWEDLQLLTEDEQEEWLFKFRRELASELRKKKKEDGD